MALDNETGLSLLAFPQSWDGQSLVVRFLCLPRRSPEVALATGLPSFRDAALAFKVCLIPGLDDTPASASAVAGTDPLALVHPPTNKAALFDTLASELGIVDAVRPPRRRRQFHKVITKSYVSAIGREARSKYLKREEDYACALHAASGEQQVEKEPATIDPNPRWGQAISYVLRQPVLAEALGLIGEASVDVDPQLLAKGVWVYIDLHDTSDGAGVAKLVARYAARVPPLPAMPAAAVPLFSAVLFPVDGTGVSDTVFREAEIYQDGLAKVVHGAQLDVRAADPAVAEQGDRIQLAWDDEQVATWLNRMVETISPTSDALAVDAPLGVSGYRVDVRERGQTSWHSLMRMSSGSLKLGTKVLGSFDGEGVIEVVPIQHATSTDAAYWLPPYFVSWRGGSLALTDSQATQLHAQLASSLTLQQQASLLTRERVFTAVADQVVPLRYGRTYEFRVRLADLTHGGPDWTVPDASTPGAATCSIPFVRRRKPGAFTQLAPSTNNRNVVILEKPRLGFAEAIFAGRSIRELKNDFDEVRTATLTREAGVFDPDVVTVRIDVETRLLHGDRAPFGTLYRTERTITADTTTIPLSFKSCATLDGISAAQPSTGPLVLPTARDVRLTFTAIGHDTPGYFATPEARVGTPLEIIVRRDEASESDDLLTTPAAGGLESFFFQPPEPGGVSPTARLAQALGLEVDGLTLRGRRGRRTVIGCSAGLRHTLSPERSAITFGSGPDLVSRWVSAVRVSLARDWTWDGMAEAGIAVTRVIRSASGQTSSAAVGAIRLPRTLSPHILGGALPAAVPDVRAPERQSTDIIFLDAFDPMAVNDGSPAELSVEYELAAQFPKAPAPAATRAAIDLPITTPPAQLPRLVSAGFALSPYAHADDYASTTSRARALWFEFDKEPQDKRDAYFVRILGYGPDPALTEWFGPGTPRPEDVDDPALPIDPEWMRQIVPNQPHDTSGLTAMVKLEPGRTPHHYLIPLPEGLTATSPELFGFFTYEIRVGHATGWTTAQGRFGPSLRVSGVQHPAPALTCEVGRSETEIIVRSPYAAAVLNGADVRAREPQTALWAQLYARVRQVDSAAWRNVLIAQTELQPQRDATFAPPARGGVGQFEIRHVRQTLAALGLASDAPLTVLTAETFNQAAGNHVMQRGWAPLEKDLGRGRILRTSALVPVPDAC